MIATIHHAAMLPNGGDVDILLDLPMPFFPPIGYKMKFTTKGSFLTVTEVQWDYTKPGELDVFVEDPEMLSPIRKMLAEGWRRV